MKKEGKTGKNFQYTLRGSAHAKTRTALPHCTPALHSRTALPHCTRTAPKYSNGQFSANLFYEIIQIEMT